MSTFHSNPFAALGGDDDDQPKVQQKAAPAAAAAPKAAPRTIPGGARPAKKAPQEAELNAEVPTAGEGKEDRAKQFGGRGGARGGRGAGRGGRGGANPRSNGGTYLGGDRPRRENGGGRVFDRQSQTGHKDSDKAEAQGWGADEGKKELEAEVEGEKDAKVEAGAETPAKGAQTPRVEEEEDNTQTYEQYLAAQASKKLNIALPEARAANDGAEDSKWAAVPVVKKEDQTTEEWLANTKQKKAPAKKEKAAKQVLEVEFSFKPPKTDRPERSAADAGRGRGRGGRGRGEGRGRGAPRGGATRGAPRQSAPAVNLADASAFPSL